MFWKSKKAKQEKKPISLAREWYNAVVFAVVVATLIRWGTVQAFVIPTPSMENTLLVGDFLFVSKLHYGPQTPRTPLQIPLTHQKVFGIQTYLPWIQLPTYRFPGFSEIKRGHVIVFNVPPASMNGGEVHPPDLKNNYVKRCVAIAGDMLEVTNKRVVVNGEPLPLTPGMKFSYLVTSRDEIHPRNFTALGLDGDDYYYMGRDNTNNAVYRMFLTESQVQSVKGLSFIRSFEEDRNDYSSPNEPLFPLKYAEGWTGDNYGPIWIPKKGATVVMNDSTLSLYGELIRDYEGNKNVEFANGKLTIDGKNLSTYTFAQDYYFMMGDNRHNSTDSRFPQVGYVPFENIVGRAQLIFFSVHEGERAWEVWRWPFSVRWSRLFTIVR